MDDGEDESTPDDGGFGLHGAQQDAEEGSAKKQFLDDASAKRGGEVCGELQPCGVRFEGVDAVLDEKQAEAEKESGGQKEAGEALFEARGSWRER